MNTIMICIDILSHNLHLKHSTIIHDEWSIGIDVLEEFQMLLVAVLIGEALLLDDALGVLIHREFLTILNDYALILGIKEKLNQCGFVFGDVILDDLAYLFFA
jgi:hypothetical protein